MANGAAPELDRRLPVRRTAPGTARTSHHRLSRHRGDLARALRVAESETAADRIPLEDYKSLRRSIVWEFNKFYWRHLNAWEQAAGQGYDKALPGGGSDGHNPQAIADDVGMFFRGMRSDGDTEVYAFTSTDRSLSAGVIASGARWGRERDSAGLAYARNFLSGAHVAYLAMGGVDGFIGDGYGVPSAEGRQAIEALFRVTPVLREAGGIGREVVAGDRRRIDRLHVRFLPE